MNSSPSQGWMLASVALSCRASLAGVPTTNPAVVSSLESVALEAVSLYESPPYSILEAVRTGAPSTVRDLISTNVAEFLSEAATATVTPSWYTQLPSGAQSFFNSQASVYSDWATKHGLTHTSGALDALATVLDPPGGNTATATRPPARASNPAAARPTGGALVASITGLAGVLGVAAVL